MDQCFVSVMTCLRLRDDGGLFSCFEDSRLKFLHPLSSNRTFTSGHTVVDHSGRNVYKNQRATSGKLYPKGGVPPVSVIPSPIANTLAKVPITMDLGQPTIVQL